MPNGSTEQMCEFEAIMRDLFADVVGGRFQPGLEKMLEKDCKNLSRRAVLSSVFYNRQAHSIYETEGWINVCRRDALRAAQASRNARWLLNTSRFIGTFGGNALSGVSLGDDIGAGWSRCRSWDELIGQAEFLCEEEESQRIVERAKDYKGRFARRYGSKTLLSLCTDVGGGLAAGATTVTMGTSILISGACMGLNATFNHWRRSYEADNNRWMAEIRNMIRSSNQCKHFPENNIPHDTPNKDCDIQDLIDPSGYVYEAVPSNRLEGVTATAYYKENVEDMYGDLHENIVKWDAAEYAQENPLFTDEYGMYAWDVPQGLWQVKFEKEGYETTYSEWLPVPPPQLDVNIAMSQARQPEVKMARAYEDAVEVEFDKYMMPESLNAENISVMENGTAVEGEIVLLNEEVAHEGATETFASKVRFNASKPFTAKEVTLTVSNRVESYAGIRMQDNYEQSFTVEQEMKLMECEPTMTVGYGETGTLTVTVLSAEASAGKTLTVKTSSPMIVGIEKDMYVLDKDGKANITVSGELPGMGALTFTVKGSDLTATTLVNVENKAAKTVANPTASVASGSVVAMGTEIYLHCYTNGATIYYTLDGSCPCGDNALIYDGTPIVITGDVTIKVMAKAPDMYESDVMEFVYSVIPDAIDDVTTNDPLQLYPLPMRDRLNVKVGSGIIRSVSLVNLGGVTLASSAKPTKQVTLDVSTLPKGMYIVYVVTDRKTYSRKIRKE